MKKSWIIWIIVIIILLIIFTVVYISDKDKPKEIVCSDYHYSNCPEECEKVCVPSVCSNGECTADCDGEGSCIEKQ